MSFKLKALISQYRIVYVLPYLGYEFLKVTERETRGNTYLVAEFRKNGSNNYGTEPKRRSFKESFSESI